MKAAGTCSAPARATMRRALRRQPVLAERFRDEKIAILNDQSPPPTARWPPGPRRAEGRWVMTEAVFETYKPGAKDYGELSPALPMAGVPVVYIAGFLCRGGGICCAKPTALWLAAPRSFPAMRW